MTTYEPPPPNALEADWIRWANELGSSKMLNLHCRAISPDGATLTFDECPWPINPNGAIHGGFIAAFADQCLGIMAARVTEPGSYPSTATLTAHYLRPAVAPLTFEAVVDRAGRKLMFMTVTVLDRAGEVSATISGCMSVLRPQPGRDRSIVDP